MFGYVIINDKNDVVFIDGDASFKNNLQSLVQRQIRSPSVDNASTSSGVCTDSTDCESSFVRKRKISTFIFNSTEISHIFLPLILLYRSTSDGRDDPINNISSALGTISILQLCENHLILAFAKKETRRRELLQIVEQNVMSCFGPLISFCNLELTTVKRAKERMISIMNTNVDQRPKPYINIKRRLFYQDKLEKIKMNFHKTASQLGVFIGKNRCLLLCHGDIVATYNSSEETENILTGLNITDLLNIASNSASSQESTKIDQFWLRSTIGAIPHYVNAITHHFIENVDLVCIVETSENTLIRYLNLFSKQLDKLKKSNDLTRDLKEIRKTISDIQILIVNYKPLAEPYSVAFMKSPSRTAHFLKTLWQQIDNEVKQINGLELPKNRSNTRFSISSLRSAFSTISLASSIFTKVSMSENMVTQKLDILLSYAKRQTNSILQELCSISLQNANQVTLPLFKQCMDKILKPNQIRYMESFQIGNEENEAQLHNYLTPTDFFLEMLAYRIQFHGNKQEICYITDSLKTDLQDLLQLQSAKTYSCNATGKSKNEYTVQYVFIPQQKPNIAKRSRSIFNQTSISITAVFPGCINKNLAEKQTNKLLSFVLEQYLIN